ncbi:MAG: outer membrane beta-barrel protein [Desulfotignum sp.]|nr:outer membrane beta-barrel protein [Desulfotignum sp.]MCF8124601.1 outer membrane beta-barrel protein [Desulfotignum sp.]
MSFTQEYQDNFFSTRTNKQEEFITTYALGFSAGFLEKKHRLYLSYSPEYKDYKNLDERDRISHFVQLDGEITPTRHTDLTYGLVYEGDSDNLEGESRNHKAFFSGTTRAEKSTRLTYGHQYTDRFDRQSRTGDYKEHTRNTTRAGVFHRYGPKNHMRVTFLYEFDVYDTPDPDAYARYQPAGYISYWFTPKHGMDTNLSYEDREFDDTLDYTRTLSGDVRFIKTVSKTFDTYVKYRHSYSETQDLTHHVFHPSVGFDWQVTEDAGISLGAGALFHDWSSNAGDSVDPFLDINAYKILRFSPRTSLSLTGTSGYAAAGDQAASLGFTTYYQAGAQLHHHLFKQVTSSFSAAFRRDEYQETEADREDTRVILGAGLSWQPLKWLYLDLSYAFTDFNTTGAFREDYTDNRLFLKVDMVPETPVTMSADPSRQALEDRLFRWER